MYTTILSLSRAKFSEPVQVRVDTPNLLSEHEHKRFSITWLEGLVTVRSDGQSGPVLMEWRDPNPIGVSYVGLRTGWGATGNWKLRFEQYPAVTDQKKRNDFSLDVYLYLFLSFVFLRRDRRQCRVIKSRCTIIS